jgi:hypothetical protein
VQFLYFVGFILTAIASWLLRDYGGSALDFSPLNKVDIPNSSNCLLTNAQCWV